MDNEYLKWHRKKSAINRLERIPFFKEKEVWWCSLGENIGNELNGKNENFTRPVLIIKKFNNSTCWVLPITSNLKDNIYNIQISINDRDSSIVLSQMKIISSKRLTKKFHKLKTDNYERVLLKIVSMLLTQNLKNLPLAGASFSRQVANLQTTTSLGYHAAIVDILYIINNLSQLQKTPPSCYNPETMKAKEIRRRFLDFFASSPRNHAIIQSAPLVPENDPSVLFNTAGMQPLVPYLLGEKHPLGTRLVNFQKCVRTVDIEDIGDNTHATFFEMMGNWSLGDYFKKEAINWSYELLTDKEIGFGLDPNRLYVTCFEGDENAPKDEESAKIWLEIFEKNNVKGNRIFFLPANNNWWSAGENGPCGADTEMFYDVSGKYADGVGLTHEQFLAADDAQEVVEIWNDVFMEYEKKDGKVIGKLATQNVDTGSGFERVAMVLQGKNNIFDTDIFTPIIEKIEELRDITNIVSGLASTSGTNEISKDKKATRIIADHIRTSVMLISDGVLPANSDQGYVLRRLIRRAVRFADVLNLKPKALFQIADIVCDLYEEVYENVGKLRETIKITIDKEEQKFRNTLSDGLKQFNKSISENNDAITGALPSKVVFDLYQSFGFPTELTKEIATEKGLSINWEEVNSLIAEHQNISRSGAEKKFKGGLGDTSDMSLRYHTATHLLHQALRIVLGDHVMQKGSNITPERLRFDFAHPEKMTDDQKKQVEDIVNEKILANLPVQVISLPQEEAEKTGALHFFGEKYSDIVTVYYIGEEGGSLEDAFSKEYCGGPHVSRTGELNPNNSERPFSIQKKEAVAQGIRRIKAVLK